MTTLRQYLARHAPPGPAHEATPRPPRRHRAGDRGDGRPRIAEEMRSASPRVAGENQPASPDLRHAIPGARARRPWRQASPLHGGQRIRSSLDEQGGFSVALQPLAGVRDLDANAAAGTIFSVSALDRPKGASRRRGAARRGDGGLRSANDSGAHARRRRRALFPGPGTRRVSADARTRSGFRNSRANARSTRRTIPAGTRPPAPSSTNSPTPTPRPNLETR